MSYGRNFSFRVTPSGGQRSGRFATPSDGSNGSDLEFRIGCGVKSTTTVNDLGLTEVAMGDDAVPPVSGKMGILVYEYGPAAFAGDDPFLTTYSDKDTAPNGKGVQVVSGPEIKVVLKNTSDRTFLNTRDYTGRTMVAGMGATPTVAIGDYLEPHATPNDTNGYWQETATLANAWLVVTSVDTDRAEVEARMLF